MFKYSFYLIIILIFSNVSIISANPTWVSLENDSKAMLWFPPKFKADESYPLLIALHGMGETVESAYEIWQPVALELNMILICPRGSNFKEGYVRYPVDDRLNLSRFFYEICKKYQIDRNRSLLAGFSRGGNFAIETGLVYPYKFKNVVCIFGFFSDRHKEIADNNINHYGNVYGGSRFLLITGQGDITQHSQSKAYSEFERKEIPVKMLIYPNLFHSIPLDLIEQIREFLPENKNTTLLSQKNKKRMYSPNIQVEDISSK